MLETNIYISICVVAITAFICLFWTLNKKAEGTLFAGLSILLIITTLRGSLSLILIETGSYIPEQSQKGYVNGSLLYFLLFSSISFLVLFLCVRKTSYLKGEPTEPDAIDLLFFIFFIFKLLVSITISYNYPQLNKFDFYAGTISPRLFLAVDLVFEALLWTQMLRRTSYFWLWACFSLFIAFSKRAYFGALFGPLEMILFALMLRGKISYKNILFFASPVIVLAISVKMMTLKGNPLLLFDRFVMDNHMFWGAINLLHSGKTSSQLIYFAQDFWNLGLYQANPYYGLGEFMSALNPALTEHFLSYKIRFTNGYPGVLLFKAGLGFAIIFHCVFMFIYFRLWTFFISRVSIFNVIELVLFYKLFSYYSDFVSMGEYGYFRGKFLIMLSFTLCFFWLIRIIRVKQSTFFGFKI